MKLKPSYETQEDIPEPLRDHYAEIGGKWLLQVEGVSNIESVDATLRKERQRAKAAEDKAREIESKLSQLGDKDLADVLKELDEIDELRAQLEAGGGKDEDAIAKRVDAAVKRATGPLERQLSQLKKERDDATSKADELSTTLTRGKVETTLREAANKAKVRPEAVPDILLHGSNFEVADDGQVVHKETQQTPEVYLTALKDDRPHWWPDTVGAGSRGNNGSGATGGNNPFDLKSPNIDAAMTMMTSDPAKAKQLMSMAGFSDETKWAEAAASAGASR